MSTFVVAPSETRSLAALVREALSCSHRRAKELIEARRVTIDGSPELRAGCRPAAGATIDVLERPAPQAAPAVTGLHGPGFKVVYADDSVVAVDKEPGVLVIPTSKPGADDPPLVARVIAAMALAGHKVRELWIVHRIDRETSGLVLFARSEVAYQSLRSQFRARLPEREYIAFTEGIPQPRSGELRAWLYEEERAARRVRAVAEGHRDAREALLRYSVARSTARPPRARVDVSLVTGRRNQIRVQLAAIRCPIIGDRFYGAQDLSLGRTALHAARLAFEHPATGERLALESPLPADLLKLERSIFPSR